MEVVVRERLLLPNQLARLPLLVGHVQIGLGERVDAGGLVAVDAAQYISLREHFLLKYDL